MKVYVVAKTEAQYQDALRLLRLSALAAERLHPQQAELAEPGAPVFRYDGATLIAEGPGLAAGASAA